MADYELIITQQADQDLEHIDRDGLKRWGEVQADNYYDALIEHFETLCDNPYLYRPVDEIREGYRRSACGKHSVFYRIAGDTVEIVALIKFENRYPVGG